MNFLISMLPIPERDRNRKIGKRNSYLSILPLILISGLVRFNITAFIIARGGSSTLYRIISLISAG